MTQRQLHHPGLPQYGWQLTKPGTLEHTALPGSSSVGPRVSIPSDSVGLTSSEQLHWFLSSRQLVWPQSRGTLQLFIAYSGRERLGRGLVNLVSFRDFLELF